MSAKLSKNGKRLGRPPKSGKVFISAIVQKEVEKVDIVDQASMMECELIPVQQYSHLIGTETKQGRYMTSYYNIEGFGKKTWVVGAYIKADWKSSEEDHKTIQKCINYLNSLGKKKKIYGDLKLHNFKFLNKNGQRVAVVEMITTDRKNDNFWGEGERV